MIRRVAKTADACLPAAPCITNLGGFPGPISSLSSYEAGQRGIDRKPGAGGQ